MGADCAVSRGRVVNAIGLMGGGTMGGPFCTASETAGIPSSEDCATRRSWLAIPSPSAERASISSRLSSARNSDSDSTCGTDRTKGGTRGCNSSSSLRCTSSPDIKDCNTLYQVFHAERDHGMTHMLAPVNSTGVDDNTETLAHSACST
jgi:hypothetical protein